MRGKVNYTIHEGVCLANRICKEVATYPFKIKNHDKDVIVRITISLGVAASLVSIEYKKLIETADKALRHSKEKGRNQVTSYSEIINPDSNFGDAVLNAK